MKFGTVPVILVLVPEDTDELVVFVGGGHGLRSLRGRDRSSPPVSVSSFSVTASASYLLRGGVAEAATAPDADF